MIVKKENGTTEWLREEANPNEHKTTKRKSGRGTGDAKGSGDSPNVAGSGRDQLSIVPDAKPV